MGSLHNLKPEQVIKALERAGWVSRGRRGSHVKPVKDGNLNILSIPVHKGKPVKIGLLKNQIRKSGLTEEEFLKLL
ncbi:MAG: type II toxin-antitoxin system HicA family toxin [Deltaproteobacteria bacterium]